MRRGNWRRPSSNSIDPESVEALRDAVYRSLDVIRVYTKAPGKKPDATPPFTLPIGAVVEDLALKVHQEIAAKLKYAKVWAAGSTRRSDGRPATRASTKGTSSNFTRPDEPLGEGGKPRRASRRSSSTTSDVVASASNSERRKQPISQMPLAERRGV